MENLTFTEEEVKKTAAFVQFVYDKAVFKELTAKEALALPRHFSHMNEHIKKMDAHVFEIKKVIKQKKADEKAAKDAEPGPKVTRKKKAR